MAFVKLNRILVINGREFPIVEKASKFTFKVLVPEEKTVIENGVMYNAHTQITLELSDKQEYYWLSGPEKKYWVEGYQTPTHFQIFVRFDPLAIQLQAIDGFMDIPAIKELEKEAEYVMECIRELGCKLPPYGMWIEGDMYISEFEDMSVGIHAHYEFEIIIDRAYTETQTLYGNRRTSPRFGWK